jgi:hypothetical protein
VEGQNKQNCDERLEVTWLKIFTPGKIQKKKDNALLETGSANEEY